MLKHVGDGRGWADPFAGTSRIAQFTNDLNPSSKADKHMDAYDFLKSFEDSSLNGVLFDPPYSMHQVVTEYEGLGMRKEAAVMRDEIARIVMPNGHTISFGWNTYGIGRSRGFEITEILIVSHGADRNDTMATVERKHRTRLDSWAPPEGGHVSDSE